MMLSFMELVLSLMRGLRSARYTLMNSAKVMSRLPSSRISKSRSHWTASRRVLKPRLVTHFTSPFQFL